MGQDVHWPNLKIVHSINELRNEVEERFSVEEFKWAFGAAFSELDYNSFVSNILQSTPRANDVWQTEKWEIFQNACLAILRLPPEYFHQILMYRK
jgi:hypothetical protein